MNKIHIYPMLLICILLLPNSASAYRSHRPISLEGIRATADDPYIIEGYEITNPDGNCLKIIDCENIVVRNNYIHDCGTDEDFQEDTDHYQEGYAVLIGQSSGITFEENILEGNWRGFMAYDTDNLLAKENNITNTLQYSSLWCERCDNSEFSYNYLSDNGNPEHFWQPGDRSIGLWVKRSEDVEIHHNTIIRSTSDGIAVTGQIYGPSFTVDENDWTGLSREVKVYENILLDNMEQGLWLVRAREIIAYNNTIRTSCFTYSSAISLEFDVDDSEFHHNKVAGCLLDIPAGGSQSDNNFWHDNILYSRGEKNLEFASFESDEGKPGKAADSGIPVAPSSNNRQEDNIVLLIGGKLAEMMDHKVELAEEEKTYEAKGWFSCEQEDGTIDEQCRAQEEAKGEIGVPREYIVFEPLMADFDEYVIEENQTDENIDDNPEKDQECKKNQTRCEGHNFIKCIEGRWTEFGKIEDRCGFSAEPEQQETEDFQQDQDFQEDEDHKENEGPYTWHEPVRIEGIRATAEEPYIIEGYEITNPDGDCIEVLDSEHVIIRNNYLHGCGEALLDMENEKRPHYEGLAIEVGNSSYVTVENNEVIDNLNGILAYESPYTIMRNNIVKKSKVWCALHCEICDNSKFYGNYLSDNGVPEWFWHPGERISSLYVLRSDNIEIYNNTVIRSTSDGIRVIGQLDGQTKTSEGSDWTGTTNNVTIYNNLVLDNMELGFAFDRGTDFKVFDNTVRSTCTGPANAITIEFDVDDSEIFNNRIIPCGNPNPIQISTSQRLRIYNNTAYYFDNRKERFVPEESYDDQGDIVKSDWSGIPYEPSSDNIIKDNRWKKIGGELAESLRERLRTAQELDLFKEHGYFSCEISEGVFDKECVQEEIAKGVQGKPAEYQMIEPLYSDPEPYVIQEQFPSALILVPSIILLVLVISTALIIWKKRDSSS